MKRLITKSELVSERLSREEAMKLARFLASHYPGNAHEMTDGVLNVYAEALTELPARACLAAVRKAAHGSRRVPSVAELREYVDICVRKMVERIESAAWENERRR